MSIDEVRGNKKKCTYTKVQRELKNNELQVYFINLKYSITGFCPSIYQTLMWIFRSWIGPNSWGLLSLNKRGWEQHDILTERSDCQGTPLGLKPTAFCFQTTVDRTPFFPRSTAKLWTPAAFRDLWKSFKLHLFHRVQAIYRPGH